MSVKGPSGARAFFQRLEAENAKETNKTPKTKMSSGTSVRSNPIPKEGGIRRAGLQTRAHQTIKDVGQQIKQENPELAPGMRRQLAGAQITHMRTKEGRRSTNDDNPKMSPGMRRQLAEAQITHKKTIAKRATNEEAGSYNPPPQTPKQNRGEMNHDGPPTAPPRDDHAIQDLQYQQAGGLIDQTFNEITGQNTPPSSQVNSHEETEMNALLEEFDSTPLSTDQLDKTPSKSSESNPKTLQKKESFNIGKVKYERDPGAFLKVLNTTKQVASCLHMHEVPPPSSSQMQALNSHVHPDVIMARVEIAQGFVDKAKIAHLPADREALLELATKEIKGLNTPGAIEVRKQIDTLDKGKMEEDSPSIIDHSKTEEKREAPTSHNPMGEAINSGTTQPKLTKAEYDHARSNLKLLDKKLDAVKGGGKRLAFRGGEFKVVNKGLRTTKSAAQDPKYQLGAMEALKIIKKAQAAGIDTHAEVSSLSRNKEFQAMLHVNEELRNEFEGKDGVLETDKKMQNAIDTQASGISTSLISREGIREVTSQALQTSSDMGPRMISVENQNFLVSTLPNGNASVIHIDSKALGKGNFGEVFKATDIQTGHVFMLKSARPEKGEIAESDLRNESNLLRFAHTNGRVPGLQAPPSPVFSFITPEGVNRVGYLTQVYNGGKMYDNKNFKPGGMSFNDKLDCLDQLLIGRENMGKLGIKHGDLKPNNTLLNHDENGNWELAISDFGGCVKYENITPQDVRADPYVGGKDPAYMTSQDRARLEGLATKYPDTPEGNKAMMNEFRTLSEARDTYAIGRTVWQIVTGDEAGAISGDQQPRYTGEDGKVSDTLSKQLDSWGPALNDLKSLISDMCQIEPDKRISPSEARQRMDAIMDKHKEKLNPDILSAEKAVEQSLGKVRNKNLANEEMLKKLGPEQAKLAKTTQQLSNAFKEMKLIENAHTLMTAKPPVLDKKGKAAAQAFLEEKGAWVKGKYDQKALKFNAGSETFEMVSRSSMSKGDIQQSIDTAYALIKETSQKVPAIKVHVFDIGSRDIPGGILKANPELGDKGYKEPNLSWANPSTVASGLGRSTLVKEFSTPEHDKLEKDATGYDVNSRYAGREAPGALNIVNHNANGAIVDLVENRLRVKPDEDATRDLQAIKDKGVRENFASTINKGLAEFQKDINQQDKQIFTKFSQAMADGNREQFVNIMRTGIEALASKLDDKDPQKAILKKMREDVKEIAGSRSWERVAESWDAFGKMVLALSKE